MIRYIIYKLDRISYNYDIYHNFKFIVEIDSKKDIFDLVINFLNYLLDDKSHITYKIWQTLNFIFLNKDDEDLIYTNFKSDLNYSQPIPFNEYSEKITGLNILFITHSPFILSDIPKQNVLYLKTQEEERIINGETKKVQLAIPQNFQNKNSFGANITDLLADSFFIDDGLIGDFAKEKINEVLIDLLKKKNSSIKKQKEMFQIIEIIDEPLIKNKLTDMFKSKYREL